METLTVQPSPRSTTPTTAGLAHPVVLGALATLVTATTVLQSIGPVAVRLNRDDSRTMHQAIQTIHTVWTLVQSHAVISALGSRPVDVLADRTIYFRLVEEAADTLCLLRETAVADTRSERLAGLSPDATAAFWRAVRTLRDLSAVVQYGDVARPPVSV